MTLDLSYLLTLAHDLENARRMGEGKDEPEGVRNILLSDTLANKIVENLIALHEVVVPRLVSRVDYVQLNRRDLQWSTELPKQAGWYWATWAGGKIEAVYYRIGKEVMVINREYEYPFSDFTHWLGPLEIPPFPEIAA